MLDWLPSPALRSWVKGPASGLTLHNLTGGGEVTITPRTPKRTVPRQSETTAGGPRNAETSFETGSHLLSYECGDDTTAISHGLLHLASFPAFTDGSWAGLMAQRTLVVSSSRAAGGRFCSPPAQRS